MVAVSEKKHAVDVYLEGRYIIDDGYFYKSFGQEELGEFRGVEKRWD